MLVCSCARALLLQPPVWDLVMDIWEMTVQIAQKGKDVVDLPAHMRLGIESILNLMETLFVRRLCPARFGLSGHIAF